MNETSESPYPEKFVIKTVIEKLFCRFFCRLTIVAVRAMMSWELVME